MRLLDRYLLRELMIPFGYCLGGFLIFWISFDLFGEMEKFQRLRLTGLDIAQYYLVKTPEFLVFPMLPAAWLLGLLYALTNHARHQELTAMRTAGIGLWRLALPYLATGFLLSVGLLAVNELWVPRSTDQTEAILNRHETRQAKAGARQWERKVGFTNARENRKWFIEAYHPAAQVMVGPHVEWTLATGTRCEVYADRAVWTNGNWTFINVRELVYPAVKGAVPMPEQRAERIMAEFSETPEEIESEIKISQIDSLREIRKAQLSVLEILRYQRLHADESPKADMLNTKLHGRLAAPWTCFVIVLIALPFGTRSGRRNVFVGVASSIVICFAYLVLSQLALALGTGGYLPPPLAAWAPNLLFGAGGVALTWRVR